MHGQRPENPFDPGSDYNHVLYSPIAFARLTYAAKQDDVPEGATETDSYAVLDLFGEHRFANGMRLGFGIGNVLDETYSIHPAVIHQPGRSLNITLSRRF